MRVAAPVLLVAMAIWIPCLGLRAHDRRLRSRWALLAEVLAAYAALCSSVAVASLVCDRAEVGGALWLIHSLVLNLVVLAAFLRLTRKLVMPKLLWTALLFCLLGGAVVLIAHRCGSGLSGNWLLAASLVGSAPFLTFSLLPVFALVRLWMHYCGDDGPGPLGSLSARAEVADSFCCLRAGKPEPAWRDRNVSSRIWFAAAETSFAYPLWLAMPIAFWLLSRATDWGTANQQDDGWRQRVTGLHAFRYQRALSTCLPNAERHLHAGRIAEAIAAAEEGLAILGSLSIRCSRALQTVLAYRLHLTLGAAYSSAERYDDARLELANARGVGDCIFFGLAIRPWLWQGRLDFGLGDYEAAYTAFLTAAEVSVQVVQEFAEPVYGMSDRHGYRLLRHSGRITLSPDSLGFAFGVRDVINAIAVASSTACEATYMSGLSLEAVADETDGRAGQELLKEAEEFRTLACGTPLRLVRGDLSPAKVWVSRAFLKVFIPKDQQRPVYRRAWESTLDSAPNLGIYPELVELLDAAQAEAQCDEIERWWPATEDLDALLPKYYGQFMMAGVSDETLACFAAIREYPISDALWLRLGQRSDRSGAGAILTRNERLNLGQVAPEVSEMLVWARVPRSRVGVAMYAWLARNEGMRRASSAPRSSFLLLRLALDLYRALGDHAAMADLFLCFADQALLLEQELSASALATIAHGLAEVLGHNGLRQRSLYYRARVHCVQEEWDDAATCIAEAVELAEKVRGGLRILDYRTLYTEDRAEVYALAVWVALARGNPREALEYAERAKARTLVEMMGNHQFRLRDGGDQALIDEDQRLQQELHALSVQPTGMNCPDASSTGADQAARRERIRTRLREVKRRIRETSAEWTTLRAVPRLRLQDESGWRNFRDELIDLVADTGERVAVVEYFVTRVGAMAFLIAPWLDTEDVCTEVLPLDAHIAAELTRIRSRVMAGTGGRPATQLQVPAPQPGDAYDRLMGPITPWLERVEASALLIVPHGDLHLFPFHALAHEDGGDRRYLIEDYPCVYLPALSLVPQLLAKRVAGSGQNLVVGNPCPPGDLPGAEREARAVSHYLGTEPLLGREATKEAVLHLAPSCDVIHLACHGELVAQDPYQSSLVFADGLLQLDEILELPLRASLVALSACNTARGRVLRGDDAVALSRAWIYAGTPAVIASLWAAPEFDSPDLMAAFYREWRTRGATRMRALHSAQVEFIRRQRETVLCETERGSPEQQARLAVELDPYRWAHFALIGDPT